jgi:hypothetical protein
MSSTYLELWPVHKDDQVRFAKRARGSTCGK